MSIKWQTLECRLVDFERKLRAGDASIRDWLVGIDGEDRQYLLYELIKVDLEYRWQRGQQPLLSDYVSQFVGLPPQSELPFELIEAEISIRHQHGAMPTMAELRSRFPKLKERIDALVCRLSHSQTSNTSAVAPRDADKYLAQRYEIQGILGRGAFSVVHRAWDHQLQRSVAIKVPRAELMDDPMTRRRALRESRAAARLSYPSIVTVFEAGEDQENLYIVSELIEGQTLETVITDSIPAPRQSATWIARMADAVHYAHQCGVVHRDIKPANIMIRADGQPMLMDFGLAHQADAGATLTKHGDMLGTPAFMSPEQAQGRAPDARSDIYSLGVVLYQALTGHLPFTGRTASVLHRVIHDEPSPPSSWDARVPLPLETICLKAMSKEPSRRYATAAELADDLRRYLDHQPILARPLGTWGRLLLWCRRQPAMAATIMIAALLVFTTLAGGFWGVLRERNRYRFSLGRSLKSDARSQLQAKDTNWRGVAMAAVAEAAALGPGIDARDELRNLALHVMSDTAPNFELETTWESGQSVAFLHAHPQRKFVVIVDNQSVLRVFSLVDGTPLAKPTRLPHKVASADLSGDGVTLITCGENGTLVLCDLSALNEMANPIISPVEGGNGVWTKNVSCVRCCAANTFVAIGTRGGDVYIATVEIGELSAVQKMRGEPLPNGDQSASIAALAWSDDGELLASSVTNNIVVWDVHREQAIQTVDVVATPRQIDFTRRAREILYVEQSLGIRRQGILNNQRRDHTGLHTDRLTSVHSTDWGVLTCGLDGTILLTLAGERIAAAKLERPVGITAAATYRATDEGPRGPDSPIMVVAGYQDGTVRKWRLATSPFVTSSSTAHRAEFLPTDDRLAVHERLIHVNGQRAPRDDPFDVPQFTSLVMLNSEGDYACGTRQGDVRCFHLNGTRPFKVLKCGSAVTCLAAEWDSGALIVGTGDGTIQRWSLTSEVIGEQYDGNLGPLQAVAVSRAGRYIAASSKRGALVLDTKASNEGSRVVWRSEHYLQESCLAFCGQRLALPTSRRHIRLLELDSWQEALTLRGHQGEIAAMVGMPDDELISASHDGTIRRWDVTTGQELHRVTQPGREFASLCVRSDGAFMLADNVLWHDWGKKPAEFIHLGILAAQFSPDGQHLVAASQRGYTMVLPVARQPHLQRSAVVLDDMEHIRHFGGHAAQSWGLDVSADGKWIATTAHDGTVKIWNVATRELVRTMTRHTHLAWCVAFSADATQLAVGCETPTGFGEVVIYDRESGTTLKVMSGSSSLARGIAYDPQGRWLVAGWSNGTIECWDTETWGKLEIPPGPRQTVHDVVFSKDGQWLAAACDDDHVAVWDVNVLGVGEEAESPRVLSAAGNSWAVAFSADGQYLAAGSSGGEITLWRIPSGERIATIKTDIIGIRSLSFSRDGNMISASSYPSNKLRIWNLELIRQKLSELGLGW